MKCGWVRTVAVMVLAATVVAASSATARLSAARLPPGLHAFYYLWYGTPEQDGRYLHWDHEVLPHWREEVRARYPPDVKFIPPHDIHSPYYPEIGCYSSRNATVVRMHMQAMYDSGISVAVVSWWGRPTMNGTHDTQGVGTDDAMPLVLDQAQAVGVKIAWHLEPYAGRSVASIKEDVEYLHTAYGTHPAVLRTTDNSARMVFYVYDSYHISQSAWALLLAPETGSLRSSKFNGFFIGLWLERNHGAALFAGGFDGAYTYFASDGFSYGSSSQHWPSMLAFAQAHGMSFVPTCGPGYDDRRIRPWNRHNFKPRRNGEYFQTMCGRAVDSAATDAVVAVCSWNEWGEGTNIEPAVPHRVPDGEGLSPATRRKLGLSDVFSDFSPNGPDFYLDLAVSIQQNLFNHYVAARQSGEL